MLRRLVLIVVVLACATAEAITSADADEPVKASATPAVDPPPPSLYDSQTLDAGFGYIRTRDGTSLSANVTLPGPADAGPYPTVVEYSGYDPSNPDGSPPAARIANLFGYATVGVNLRGTGCSGGAWSYFGEDQALDGYDVIETIAAQPWVANGKVGMVGISYSGITQLFVAATRPPHLAAITPLSVIDDTYDTLYPGGIFNDGFGLEWAKDREHDAQPGASGWARRRIEDGDETCAKNQTMRDPKLDVLDQIERYRFRDGAGNDALAPDTVAGQITVPVFIAGSWQDEETGAHFAEMLDDFAPGVPVKATVMNGLHADSLSPEIVVRWLEFLDFYVAEKVPTIPPERRALVAAVLSAVYPGGVTIPPDRFDPNGDFNAQLAAYEAEPMLRVRFDVGAGTENGEPVAAFETTAAGWPVPGTVATEWWFDTDGGLVDSRPMVGAPNRYRYDPEAFPKKLAQAGERTGLGSAPQYDWKALPSGRALTYTSTPLASDTTMVGAGSADVWLRSTADDVDLEVTISELRPDGQETYVQSGWLRAGMRALDPGLSTALVPVPTFAKADVTPLPRGKLSLVRVPIYPFGHVFRRGSQIRVTVQPPGGNRPSWTFDTLHYRQRVVNHVGVSGAHASKVVLPVVSRIDVPTPLPACGSLRGQPCRADVETST